MARVITFSTTFPAHHSRAGQPTYFPHKFWASIANSERNETYIYSILKMLTEEEIKGLDQFPENFADFESIPQKHHIIRMGNRWKVGDWFSPRIWSGTPRRSKQLKLGDDVQIDKVWQIESKKGQLYINEQITSTQTMLELAKNDGLTLLELLEWFEHPKPFIGQIICWNNKVAY